jgi:uncharacterized protein YecE (DUF72 family)
MSRRRGAVRIGTSGYHYAHWKGVFYPRKLSKDEWFAHYAGEFDTVEINNTFYHLPSARTFTAWREEAPRGFLYAVKLSRYATHLKHLKDPRGPLRKFLGRAKRLGPALGPILVQLPPNWKPDAERLTGFLEAAPRTHRWAIEVRDRRWLCEEIFGILEEHGAALCLHDLIEDHPRRLTAGWVYLRFHGERYGGSYSHQYLTARAREIREYRQDDIDTFAYFNNDRDGHAVHNAADLRRYVEGE